MGVRAALRPHRALSALTAGSAPRRPLKAARFSSFMLLLAQTKAAGSPQAGQSVFDPHSSLTHSGHPEPQGAD